MSEKNFLEAIQKGAKTAGEEAAKGIKDLPSADATIQPVISKPPAPHVEVSPGAGARKMGKDVDDSPRRIKSPFDAKRRGNVLERQQREEDERARIFFGTDAASSPDVATSVAAAVDLGAPTPQVDLTLPGDNADIKPVTVEKARAEKEKKARAFMDSVPRGATIELTSKNGSKAYYHRDPDNNSKYDDFLVGKAWKRAKNDTITIDTDKVWKRLQDGWIGKIVEEAPSKKSAGVATGAEPKPAAVDPATPAPEAVVQEPASPEAAHPEPGAPRSPEAAPAAAPQETPETMPGVDFKKLEKNLEEARQRYAKDDFEKTSILRKISAVLRFDTTKLKDVDGAKEEYDKAFQDLLNARLEDIQKRRNELGEENYRREMGQTLTSFECEGRIKIFQARQQVRMESLAQSKIGWLVESVPRLAHAYNKLPKGYRYGIGIALGLGAMATFGTGAAAFTPIIVGLRRVLTGASTFATLDTLMESFSDRYHEGKVEKSGSETYAEFAQLEKEERTPEEIAQAKSEFLEARMKGIHEQYKRRKVGMVARKTTAVAAGLFMGSGYMQEKIGGWIKGGFDWFKGVPPIEAHSGDSTWKLLGQYLSAKDSHFSGMNEAQRTYAIDALKDKLQAMSPDQLKLAGFHSGDISQLGIGEHINFDKLVGGNVAEAMKGASGLSPEAMESITHNNAAILEWAKTHPGVKLTDTLVDSILQGKADGVSTGSAVIERLMEDGDDPDYTPHTVRIDPLEGEDAPDVDDESLSDSPPVSEVSPPSEPVFTAELQPRVESWFHQIFNSENANGGRGWMFESDKAAIAKVKLWDVLQDAKLLQQSSFSGYVTGLNSEQINNFAEFSQNVAKNNTGFNMGAFLRENPNASVMDYLQKVAPLVKQGTRLGLYSTTH